MLKANSLIKLSYITVIMILGAFAFPSVGAEDHEECGNACHVIKPYDEGAKHNENLLAFTHHTELEVPCADCHERTDEEIAYEEEVYKSGDFDNPLYRREYENDFCFNCHATYTEEDGLIQRTAHLEEEWGRNPHESHLGEDVECYQCHRMHEPSQFICAECHKSNWEEKLSPGWVIPE